MRPQYCSGGSESKASIVLRGKRFETVCWRERITDARPKCRSLTTHRQKPESVARGSVSSHRESPHDPGPIGRSRIEEARGNFAEPTPRRSPLKHLHLR